MFLRILFIWKFDGLYLILLAIGKWYTFQLLCGTLFDYHIQIFLLILINPTKFHTICYTIFLI